MISSNKGVVKTEGYGFEILADFDVLVCALKRILAKFSNEKAAKYLLADVFMKSLLTDSNDEAQNMMDEIIKKWRE